MAPNRELQRRARELAARESIKYTEALRALRALTGEGSGRPIHASTLQDALVVALRAQGWQVEQQHGHENGEYICFAGAAQLAVGRAGQLSSIGGDEDPDDGDLVDLTVPPDVDVTWPFIDRPWDAEAWDAPPYAGGVFFELPGDAPIGQLVTEINRRLGEARLAAVRAALPDTECTICGDAYPARHLLPDETDPVCPVCLFDGDLTGWALEPFGFAELYDAAYSSDPALPTTWTALAVLVACVMPAPDTVAAHWPDELLSVPHDHWADPRRFTLWLPPVEQRIPALRQLGAAASVGAIMDVLDAAHPGLRQRLVAERSDEWSEVTADPAMARSEIEAELVVEVWPAVVAYAVAAATQQAERSDQRGPWHYGESFEATHLRPMLKQAGSRLEPENVERTLYYSTELARTVGLLGAAGPEHP